MKFSPRALRPNQLFDKTDMNAKPHKYHLLISRWVLPRGYCTRAQGDSACRAHWTLRSESSDSRSDSVEFLEKKRKMMGSTHWKNFFPTFWGLKKFSAIFLWKKILKKFSVPKNKKKMWKIEIHNFVCDEIDFFQNISISKEKN